MRTKIAWPWLVIRMFDASQPQLRGGGPPVYHCSTWLALHVSQAGRPFQAAARTCHIDMWVDMPTHMWRAYKDIGTDMCTGKYIDASMPIKSITFFLKKHRLLKRAFAF